MHRLVLFVLSMSGFYTFLTLVIAFIAWRMFRKFRLSRRTIRLPAETVQPPDGEASEILDVDSNDFVDTQADVYYVGVWILMGLIAMTLGWMIGMSVRIMWTAGSTLRNFSFDGEYIWNTLYSFSWIVATYFFTKWYVNYLKRSFRKIPDNRWYILKVFERPLKVLRAGPVMVFEGLCSTVEMTKAPENSDIPDSPEFIDHGDPNVRPDGTAGTGTVKEGYTPALRCLLRTKSTKGDTYTPEFRFFVKDSTGTMVENVVTANPPLDRNSPLLLSQTIEVEASYAFAVERPLVVYRRGGNLDKIKEIMDDHVVSGINTILPALCPIEVALFTQKIEEIIRAELDVLAQYFGVVMQKFMLKPIGFSHQFNTSLMEVPRALNLKQKKITDAEGYEAERRKHADGDAYYQRTTLEALAAGQDALAAVARKDGYRTLEITQTAEAVKVARAVVLPPGGILSDLMSAKLTSNAIDEAPGIVLTDENGFPINQPPTPQPRPGNKPPSQGSGGGRGRGGKNRP